MGAYATYSDLVAQFSEGVVNGWAGLTSFTALSDDDLARATATVETYIERAESRINSVLRRRYVLPLSDPADDVRMCTVAFAAYYLTATPQNVRADSIKDLYTEWKDWLDAVRDDKAVLDYATTEPTAAPERYGSFAATASKLGNGIF